MSTTRYHKTMNEALQEVDEIATYMNEVSPPGWEGTVKAMKKHSDIDNPWALAWHMKKKGYKSHKKEETEVYWSSKALDQLEEIQKEADTINSITSKVN